MVSQDEREATEPRRDQQGLRAEDERVMQVDHVVSWHEEQTRDQRCIPDPNEGPQSPNRHASSRRHLGVPQTRRVDGTSWPSSATASAFCIATLPVPA